MSRKNTAYYVTTALFSLTMLPGIVMDIAQPPFVHEAMAIIDVSMTLLLLIGVWKVLGLVGLWQRRFPTLSEWAYAGFFFDLTGASYLHAAEGDTLVSVITPLVMLPLLFASHHLRASREAQPVVDGGGRAAVAA